MGWRFSGVDGEGGGAEVQSRGEDRGAPRQRQRDQVRDGLHQEVRSRAQRSRQRRRAKVSYTTNVPRTFQEPENMVLVGGQEGTPL